jgi:hypothetical protein
MLKSKEITENLISFKGVNMVGKRDLGKLKIFSAFLVGLFLLLFYSHLAQAQWEGAVVQRMTFDTLPDQSPQLFIDENDKLHLFYEHGTESSPAPWDYWLLYRTKEKGKPWSEPDTIRYFGAGQSYYLTYDGHFDIVHLLSCYLGADYTRLYYTNSSLGWVPVTVDSGGTGPGSYQMHQLDIDTSGYVHIAWQYGFSIDTNWYAQIVYVTNFSGTWVKQEPIPPIYVGDMGAGGIYLQVETTGRAHIMYDILYPRPYFYVPRYVCHAYNNEPGGNIWHIDTLDGPTYGNANMVIDKDNHMHMGSNRWVGFDIDSAYVYYSYRANLSEPWSLPEEITWKGVGPGLFIDREDNVHAYWIGLNSMINHKVFYANKKSGNWQSIMLLDTEPYLPWSFNFVIDSEGKGHGVFRGYCNYPSIKKGELEIYYLGESGSGVDSTPSEKELKFQLSQNYPNPFNSFTTIPFAVHGKQKTENSPIPTTLKIYNILGEEVRTLVDEKKKEGQYQVVWDGKDEKGKEVSSGIYIYVLKCGQYKQNKKMILIK